MADRFTGLTTVPPNNKSYITAIVNGEKWNPVTLTHVL